MPKFGKTSLARLDTVHPDLRGILKQAIQIMDFSIIEGYRSCTKQNRLFDEGKSQLRGGSSKHNSVPSMAVDIAPYYTGDGIRWNDTEAMCILYGIVRGIAWKDGISIRWGGDWDSDLDRADQTFDDVWHIELVA